MQITGNETEKQYEWSGIPWQKWRISSSDERKAAAAGTDAAVQQKDFQSITVTDVVREAISTAAHFMRIIGTCMTCAIRSRQG